MTGSLPTPAPGPPPIPPRRRRWRGLSVRGLMLLVLVVGGLIGWEANRVARFRRAIATLRRETWGPTNDWADLDRSRMPAHPDGKPAARVTVSFERRGPAARWLAGWLDRVVGEDHFRAATVIHLDRPPGPEDWEAIGDLGTVREICFSRDFDGRGLLGLAGVAARGRMRRLRTLDLEVARGLTPADLEALAGLDGLEELTLNCPTASEVGLAHLGGLRDLRTLDLGMMSGVGDRGLECLRGLTRLETLQFGAAGVTDRGLAALAALPSLRHLRIIATDWSPGAPSVTLSPAGIEALGRFRRLESLGLFSLAALDDAWLAAIGRLTRLRDLKLESGRITDEGLARLRPLAGLERLAVGSGAVTDAGLAHLKALGRLDWLYLHGEGITDAGLAALAALPSLTHLMLHGDGITDAGLPRVGALSGLTSLHLNSTKITNAGMTHLGPLPRLTELDVRPTRVDEDGAAAARAAVPTLTRVMYDPRNNAEPPIFPPLGP